MSRRPKGDHYEVSGEVELSFHYREVVSHSILVLLLPCVELYFCTQFYGRTLTVHIIKASGLAAVDKSTSSSNPYVKMQYFLPDKQSKRKTRVKRRTLDPFFDQSFDVSS